MPLVHLSLAPPMRERRMDLTDQMEKSVTFSSSFSSAPWLHFSNFDVLRSEAENLTQIQTLIQQVFAIGLRFCVSVKLSRNADAAGLWAILEGATRVYRVREGFSPSCYVLFQQLQLSSCVGSNILALRASIRKPIFTLNSSHILQSTFIRLKPFA